MRKAKIRKWKGYGMALVLKRILNKYTNICYQIAPYYKT